MYHLLLQDHNNTQLTLSCDCTTHVTCCWMRQCMTADVYCAYRPAQGPLNAYTTFFAWAALIAVMRNRYNMRSAEASLCEWLVSTAQRHRAVAVLPAAAVQDPCSPRLEELTRELATVYHRSCHCMQSPCMDWIRSRRFHCPVYHWWVGHIQCHHTMAT